MRTGRSALPALVKPGASGKNARGTCSGIPTPEMAATCQCVALPNAAWLAGTRVPAAAKDPAPCTMTGTSVPDTRQTTTRRHHTGITIVTRPATFPSTETNTQPLAHPLTRMKQAQIQNMGLWRDSTFPHQCRSGWQLYFDCHDPHDYEMTPDRVKGDKTTNTVRELEVRGVDASINLEDLVDLMMRDMKRDRLPLLRLKLPKQKNHGRRRHKQTVARCFYSKQSHTACRPFEGTIGRAHTRSTPPTTPTWSAAQSLAPGSILEAGV